VETWSELLQVLDNLMLLCYDDDPNAI
jgi:hypothetical protein